MAQRSERTLGVPRSMGVPSTAEYVVAVNGAEERKDAPGVSLPMGGSTSTAALARHQVRRLSSGGTTKCLPGRSDEATNHRGSTSITNIRGDVEQNGFDVTGFRNSTQEMTTADLSRSPRVRGQKQAKRSLIVSVETAAMIADGLIKGLQGQKFDVFMASMCVVAVPIFTFEESRYSFDTVSVCGSGALLQSEGKRKWYRAIE